MRNHKHTNMIPGLTEFNQNGATETPPTTTPTPQPVLPAAQPQVPAGFVPREEHEAALGRARSEEKTKLHKDIEASRRRAQELEAEVTQLRNAGLSDVEQIKRTLETLTAENAKLAKLVQEEQNARRASELAAYRERVIRERGIPNEVAGWVVGASEAEIEQAAQVAIAEYAHMEEHFRARFAPPAPPAQPAQQQVDPAQAMAPTPPVQQPFPASVQPAPVAQPGFTNEVADLTSYDAIRNGTYAKNREALLGRVRGGAMPAAQLPMRPVMPMTAPAPQQPQYGPNYVAVPSQMMPGGQQQPMGLPSAPVRPTQMAQPLPAQSPDASLVAAAAQAAHNALAHPDAAMSQVQLRAAPRGHMEYRGAVDTNAPPASALAGGHPMVRNN